MSRIPFHLAAIVCIGAGAVSAANFFPLQNGNTWTYRQSGRGQRLTVQVGAPVVRNEVTYFPLSGYVDRRVLVRHEGEQLRYLDENTGSEAILSSFEPFEGGWWNANVRQ